MELAVANDYKYRLRSGMTGPYVMSTHGAQQKGTIVDLKAQPLLPRKAEPDCGNDECDEDPAVGDDDDNGTAIIRTQAMKRR
jgi:hypothetical protein